MGESIFLDKTKHYMVGYIYLITDTTNGMKYTGKHHYHIEGQLDPNYHGSGVIIKNIYKKRPETLKEEYIKTCYSEEEMCNDEKYYIKFYDTLWPNGYNLTEGGDGLIPCEETRRKLSNSLKGKPASNKGIPMSEEQKKKLSDVHKGKKLSEEHKKKISDSHSGEKHPMFGKHLSEETKRKISSSHKGKKLSEETKKKLSNTLKGKPAPNKGVPMSEEQKKKISSSLKGLFSGEKHPMFGKHLSEETKRKMSSSHKGKPAPNKGKPMSEETKKKMSKARINGKLSKPVLQLSLDGELIREWPSMSEIERQLGYKNQAISACCLGKRKSHKGFRWKFKD